MRSETSRGRGRRATTSDGPALVLRRGATAQAILNRPEARQKQMPELAEKGWAARDIFMSYAVALEKVGKFPLAMITTLKEGSGYVDLVEDLTTFVEWFREYGHLYTLPQPVARGSVA